jgi:hypothetical protein
MARRYNWFFFFFDVCYPDVQATAATAATRNIHVLVAFSARDIGDVRQRRLGENSRGRPSIFA